MSYPVDLVFPVCLQVQEVTAIPIRTFCIFGKLARQTEAPQGLYDRL